MIILRIEHDSKIAEEIYHGEVIPITIKFDSSIFTRVESYTKDGNSTHIYRFVYSYEFTSDWRTIKSTVEHPMYVDFGNVTLDYMERK